MKRFELSVSVVMPTRNRAGFIGEALDSLAKQTIPPLEVIVVDDASTDDTRERVEGHAFVSRVRYLKNAENRGASDSRNRGVSEAKGDVIVFLDSDDVVEREHHEVALTVLKEREDVALFCCDATMIGPNGETLLDGRSFTDIRCGIKKTTIESGPRSLLEIFRFSTPFPGFSIRRDVYTHLGGLTQAIFPLDDYELQIRVAGAGYGVHYEHRTLARYRIHGGNESGAARAVRVCEQKLRCLEEAFERYSALRTPEARARERLAEVRQELGVSLVKEGRRLRGLTELARAALLHPRGTKQVVGMARRRMGRWLRERRTP